MRVALILAFCGAQAAETATGDRAAFCEGAREIAAPGLPGTLSVFGERAFAVVAARGSCVVAAARYEEGRVVAFGHGGYLGNAEALGAAQTERFVANAIRWAVRGKERPRALVRGAPAVAARLGELGCARAQTLAAADLCVEGRPDRLSAGERDRLLAFVARGGGLLCAATGWGWQQLHPGKRLARDFAGNRLLYAAGLAFTGATLRRTGRVGFPTAPVPPPLVHTRAALALLETTKGDGLPAAQAELVSGTLQSALASLPEDDEEIVAALRSFLLARAPEPHPTRDAPIGKRAVVARLAVFERSRAWRERPPKPGQARRLAAAFPGRVGEGAAVVSRRIAVEPGLEGWTSTGLYAKPGEPVELRVLEEPGPKGWKLRVGCHTDRLWHKDSWSRWPEIAEAAAIAGGRARLRPVFGGLVYVDVGRRPPKARVEVELRGAVAAPLFVLGETGAEDWNAQRGEPAAPWGEIQGAHLVLSLPSRVLRDLADPAPVLRFWDRVWDAHSKLLGKPMGRRRERFVPDLQISAGFMHAGYPIMTQLRSAALSVDLARLAKEGSWGHFHELGHNAQQSAWTFAGTGEVTCNLFSLHAMQTVVGVGAGHRGATKAREKAAAYVAAGGDFERFKREPFLALEMYRQLRRAFGWKSFTAVFRGYDATARARRPKTDAQKRDAWCRRMSRQVGRNLAPFFARWAVPLSPGVATELAELEAWDGR